MIDIERRIQMEHVIADAIGEKLNDFVQDMKDQGFNRDETLLTLRNGVNLGYQQVGNDFVLTMLEGY